MPKTPKTLKHPVADEKWRDNLRAFSMQVGFRVILSKAMLEFLCATADDVCWDRSLYHSQNPIGENWWASSRSLEKRGLIRRKSEDAINNKPHWNTWAEACDFSLWELTPAGRCIVDLVKLAGMFVEADAAINKKARRA